MSPAARKKLVAKARKSVERAQIEYVWGDTDAVMRAKIVNLTEALVSVVKVLEADALRKVERAMRAAPR